MNVGEFLELEAAMLRRFHAFCEGGLSADEQADFAELDAAYELAMDRLFAEQLAEEGLSIESMLAESADAEQRR